MAQNKHMLSVNMGDGNVQSGNITGSFNSYVYKSDKDAEIMRWLSPLEPNNRHQDVRTERLDGIGDWVLETKEFREWRGGSFEADNAVLFCSGDPGVGKTFLSSLVIDSLCDQEGREDILVAGLYCDFLIQQEQTATKMIGAILKQLVGKRDIPEYLREALQEEKMKLGGRGPRLSDLMRMLRITITSLPQVVICIDALDECLPKHLPEFLGSLRDIFRESPKTRIFLTGRPHITEDIRRYFAKAIVIPISPKRDDIWSYLEMKLDRDAEPEAMNDSLRADILRTILEKTSDIFLLVSLHIEAILGEVTIRQRRKKLEEMTQGSGLSDAYTATLTRLKTQKGNKSILGLKVLMWVLYSERPLKTKELCHALGVEPGSTDLDLENIPALRTLLASSLGLVTVEASSSTLRLVHFTLQEHLLSDSTLFYSSHSTIAESCLSYLNFQCVRDLSPTLCSPPAIMPLLEYASLHWGEHTRKGMTENVKILALRLLNKFDQHISAQLILLPYDRIFSLPRFCGNEGPIGFTGLHGTAFLGIVEILPAVLEMEEWDANSRDCMSCTPLIWAAVRGHEEVVKMLLERGDVNPYLGDIALGRPPLLWAITKGHEGVARVFLEREGVNPDQANPDYYQMAFYIAASHGCEGIVKMLLQREDVNPNLAGTDENRTALSLAAEEGHERVVKMLLEREDINPNLADTEGGMTSLAHAAREGHEGIVKMFLERNDVEIDTQDDDGHTPFTWALIEGHNTIAWMISEQDGTNSYITDPTIDFIKGYNTMPWVIPEQYGTNSDTTDPSGQESLSSSAEGEEEFTTEIELRDYHSNTNTANPNGEPASPPADSNVPERVPDWEGSVSDSADSIVFLAKPSCPHQPLPLQPPKFSYSPSQTATHPNDTPSTFMIVLNRNFIVASFVCVSAFLFYVLLFSLPGTFSFS